MAHVTFIHGIANKPPAGPLLDLWLHRLAAAGLDLPAAGVTSAMVYWADVLYDRPVEGVSSAAAMEEAGAEPVPMDWREGESHGERAWTAELAAKLQAALAAQEAATSESPARVGNGGREGTAQGDELDQVLLPWFVKERLMETLLRDLHHYLWNAEHSPRPGVRYRVQDEIRRRTVRTLAQGTETPGPHVVVGHGMGTVIAYDCLKRVEGCPPVDALVTLGSPLGLDEVRQKLQPGWTRDDGFPGETVRGDWINLYDRFDPVAGFDPHFADDFRRQGRPVLRDVNEQNYGKWRHSAGKYLGGSLLGATLRTLLGLTDEAVPGVPLPAG
jgi:hypothetical protein